MSATTAPPQTETQTPPVTPEGLLSMLSRPLAFEALQKIHELTGDSDTFRGGILFIATHFENHPELNDIDNLRIGTPMEDLLDFNYYASEKARRVFHRRFREGVVDQIASSRSAHPSIGHYSGCILAEKDNGSLGKAHVFISFSGANQTADEAFCFILAELLGLDTPEYENSLLPKARRAMVGVVTED